MRIDFIKCHGTGNDFVLIDEIGKDYDFTEEGRKDLAIELCSSTGPIGADGILFIMKGSRGEGKMRIFNSDGSEAEMCGNGLRCVGRYLMELTGKDIVEVETMKARYLVKGFKDIYPGVKTVEIGIDTVSFDPKSLPMSYNGNRFLFEKIHEFTEENEFSTVSITNPHLISIVEDIRVEELVRIGEMANNSPIFPKGVNLSFVKLLDKGSIYVKTFERGVGLTKSCGTGMTASSVVTCLYDNDRFGREINIYNDGGMIKCIVSANEMDGYKVRFIGNASLVYNGCFDTETGKLNMDYEPYMSENKAYEEFFDGTKRIVTN